MKRGIHEFHQAQQPDWYGLAGMHVFNDGKEPLLSERYFTLIGPDGKVLGGEYTAILDAVDITFIINDEKEGSPEQVWLPIISFLKWKPSNEPTQEWCLDVFEALFPDPERRISMVLLKALGASEL